MYGHIIYPNDNHSQDIIIILLTEGSILIPIFSSISTYFSEKTAGPGVVRREYWDQASGLKSTMKLK